jgi:tRNA threonylcarbamoyladenosine biosynthesis protein TsaE
LLRREPRSQELDLAHLLQWGRALGEQLSPPCFIALSGDLGAGKTTLAGAICAGFGVAQSVTSPTFSLINKYETSRAPLYHVDLYRVQTPREVAELGLLELLGEKAIVLLEWPERAVGVLPEATIHIRLEHSPHNLQTRNISVTV